MKNVGPLSIIGFYPILNAITLSGFLDIINHSPERAAPFRIG
jgi:hypothetical protein